MKPKYILGGSCLVLALIILLAQSGVVNSIAVPPIPQSLSALIIEETEDRTPELAMVLLSPAVRGLFEEGEFAAVDKDVENASPEMAEFIDQANVRGLPTLFLLDQDGETVYTGDVPATPGEFATLLSNKYGGQ